MDIAGSSALVTGANRGFGRALATQLVERGAKTVYAAVRDPATVTDDRLVPIRFDVTDAESVRRAAAQLGDVDLVINNAGIGGAGSLLSGDIEGGRAVLETNFFGPATVIREFAPVLGRNGGGAVVNVLSVLSWLTSPSFGAYAASKAAAWSLTNSARAELRGQGTQVLGVHVGFMDTDLIASIDAPKLDPAAVATQVLDALESGAEELLADDLSREIKSRLTGPPSALTT
ncbi:SDR family oxidoreductase [Pseudonocardia ailaonensis]|uniref:SDR family oxidoreductase n=1 Tax=Pseudonocardia ailaonensis TaxID=367279 RepID=A0ABN2NSB3_9PSEU